MKLGRHLVSYSDDNDKDKDNEDIENTDIEYSEDKYDILAANNFSFVRLRLFQFILAHLSRICILAKNHKKIILEISRICVY